MKTAKRKLSEIVPPGATSTTTPSGILTHDPEAIPALSIDAEIRDLIPPATKMERDELEKSLLAEGCLDRLKGWAQTGILLDGHRRKQICDVHEIEFDVEWLTFEDRQAAIDFVLGLQLGRRNITDEQRVYLIGKRLENEKQRKGGDQKSKHQVDASITKKGKTANRIATELGTSPATVERNGVFAKAVDRLGGPGSIAGLKLVGGQVKMSDAAAKLILKLPSDKLAEVNARVSGGSVKTVEAALVKAKATPVQMKMAATKTKAAKAETNRGVGETEFRETVLNRLRELKSCLAHAQLNQLVASRRRVDELLAFVEAWQ